MTNRKKRPVPSYKKGRDKAKSSKLAQAIKALIKELDLAGRKFQKSLTGQRDQLYASMQTAQRVIDQCLGNKSIYSELVRAVQDEKKKAGKRSLPFNLSLEAVARATRATTDKARKLASKRAKVLDYFRKIGVQVEDTATTVKEEGIENLYAKVRKESGKPKKTRETKSRQPDSKVKPTISPPAGRDVPRAGHNDTEASMVFWMKQSDRAQLLQSNLNTMSTILVSRVSVDDGDVQVKLVAPGNHLSDWED